MSLARPLRRRVRLAAREYAGLDRRIWTLAVVRAVNTMGLSLVMAFMGLYLVTQRGVSGAGYGGIYFVANVCQALANSYTGHLSDRVGRRRLMVAALASRGAVIALLGGLVLARAPIAVLAVVLVVSASLRGGFEPVASAVVADVAPADKRVAAFGLQRMGVNVGWLIGPSLGGLLASQIDFGFIFFVAVPPILISSVVVARMSEPRVESAAARAASESLMPTPAALSETSPRPRGEITLLLVGAMLFSVVQVQLFSTFSIYAKSEVGLPEQQIGLLYAVNGLAVVLLQVPAVALISRFSHERALVAGPLIYVFAFLGMGLATGPFTLGAAVLLTTIGEVVVAPAQQATVAELGDPTRLGRAYGVFGTMQMLGVALAPLAGGLAYDHLRDRPLLMWGCLAALPALLIGVYGQFGALRRRRARADNQPGVWESQTES
ncbi:MAG TPA: MFS transporter [Kofleriaceae bacterium]|nr:MFS transporter [Kofleriaceae bacterium]